MKRKFNPGTQKGQIVVEYVLLLSIAVSIAMIIVSQMIKRDADDPENSGALIRKWQQMQEAIGKDVQN
jgi:hypothetical protein